jgi:predicted site-specific integrase-resolvase
MSEVAKIPLAVVPAVPKDESEVDEHILSMDEILGSQDVEYATIEGWKAGTKIRIGSLSAGDLIEWTEANEGEAKKTAGLRLIVKSLVDSNGRRIATDRHLSSLRNMNHKQTERIIKDILKLNGMRLPGMELY